MPSSGLSVARTAIADRLQLTKPRITAMVVFTALVGFVMAGPGSLRNGRLAATLLGTALVAAGAAALNQVLEKDTDALMSRTRERPLPAGRIRTREARLMGSGLTVAGLVVLWRGCGVLPALVALVTWLSYLFVYTPLKRRTSLATLVGAVPGALPPVIGWTAAQGEIAAGAAILFAILFLWQIPHFLAIAWLYREDYARAGFPLLPVLDREGTFAASQAVLHSLALLLLSLTPAAVGMAGGTYLAGAFVLGLALTAFALRLLSTREPSAARGLFFASVLYLPALSSLLLAARP